LNPFGKYKLTGDPGAVLTYSGSGDAISTPSGSQLGVSQLVIEGFQLKGNPQATAGIHLLPTNYHVGQPSASPALASHNFF
jgi:hypothetical protein